MKAGTHSALGERSHTRAHTAKQGHSLPRPQCGFALPVNSFLFRHAFIYIHFPVHREPPLYQQGEKIRQSCRHSSISDHLSSCFSTSRTNVPRLLSRVKAGTHSAFGEGLHTTAHAAKHGPFRTGALSLPSERSTRFGNPAWPGGRTANFAAFGSWSEALLKDTESLRNSDALMRVAVPQASRPRWAA